MRSTEFKQLILSTLLSLALFFSFMLFAPVSRAQSDDAPAGEQETQSEQSNEDGGSSESSDSSDSSGNSGDDAPSTSDDQAASEAPEPPADGEKSEASSSEPVGNESGKSAADEAATAVEKTAAEPAATVAPDATKAASAPEAGAPAAGADPLLTEKRGSDYYDRRATDLLKKDETVATVKEHPLASAYPNQYVIVCEAGCPSEAGAEIVSIKPRQGASELAPAEAPVANIVSCVGGCAGGPETYAANPGGSGTSIAAGQIGEWMTTVSKAPAGQDISKPAPGSANGSGTWMAKINEDQGIANPAAPTAKPAPAANAPEAPKSAVKALAAGESITTVVAPAETAKPAGTAPVNAPVSAEAKPAAEASIVAKREEAAKTAAMAKALDEAESTPPPATEQAAKPEPAKTPESVVASDAMTEAKPEPETGTPPATVPAKDASADAPKPAAAVEPAKMAEAAVPAQPAEAPASPAPAAATSPDPTAAKAADMAKAAEEMRVAELTTPQTEAVKPATPSKDKVMSVSSEDAVMNAAVAKARETLPQFWTSYEKPGPGEADFALKVAISDEHGTEHIWLTRIAKAGEKFTGMISNEPQSVKKVKAGQTYEFNASEISDWTFKRNGKFVGNETMRAVLPRMPEAQAAQLRSMYETP